MNNIFLVLDRKIENNKTLFNYANLIKKQVPSSKIIILNLFKENKPLNYKNIDLFINLETTLEQCYDFPFLTYNLSEILKTYHHGYIFFLANEYGRILAPMVASSLESGIVADVTKINFKDEISFTRPAYDNNIFAQINFTNSPFKVASLRIDSFNFEDEIKESNFVIQNQKMLPFPTNLKIKNLIHVKEEFDIKKYKIIISGGKGAIQFYDQLKQLAEILGAEYAGSRMLVDANIISRQRQIGQSGNIITPDLYIACGISGSIQHVEGIKNTKTIISININKNAPINALANIVVIGDAKLIINKLIDIL